jgi:hypothetical protein
MKDDSERRQNVSLYYHILDMILLNIYYHINK